jgi:tetratricopeptide (TPR) repeat protein
MNIPTKLIIVAILCVATLQSYSQSKYPGFEYFNAKDTLVYNAAWAQYEKNDYEGAIKTLKSLGNKYDADAATNRLIGLCLTELAEYEKALTLFGLAISNSPRTYGLFVDRAGVWAKMDFNRAYAADLAAYVIYFPDDAEQVYNFALALYELGRTKEALAWIEEFKDKDESLLILNAWLLAELENYAKAAAILEDVLKTSPESQQALEDIAVYYYYAEAPEPGIAKTDKLIQLKPEYGRAYYLRGLLMQLNGRDYEAELDFDTAEAKGYKIPVEEETDVE